MKLGTEVSSSIDSVDYLSGEMSYQEGTAILMEPIF
jgi:hypothetical protein